MDKFLQNLKIFLEFMPEGYLEEEKKAVQALAQKENLSDEEKNQVIEFARNAHKYIYGYKKVFNDCCRVKEEAGIHNYFKDEGLRKRFDKFVREGGDVEKIRQGKIDEEYLSQDDVEAFQHAEKEVHKEVHREVRERIKGQDKEKFEEYVKEGEEKVKSIEAGVSSLRQMAIESAEWGEEISQKIKELEERWVNYENEPLIEDVSDLLEYYNSVIE